MDDNEANKIRRINQHRLSVDGIYGAIVRRSSARASVSSQGSAYDLEERLRDVSSPTNSDENPLHLTEYDRLKLEAKNQSAVLNLRRMSGLTGFLDDDDYQLDLESNLKELVEEEIEEISDDEVEPDIKIELTNEDADGLWEGMLDTAIPASSIPPDAKPVSNMVCDGISELSSTLNYLEQKNGQAHDEIKEDVSNFIKQLSEKLVDKSDEYEDPEIAKRNDKKLALLRQESGRMDQLREEQARNRRDKKLRDIQERDEHDQMDSLVVPGFESDGMANSEPESPDTDEEAELNLIPGISEQQTIQEEEITKTDAQLLADKEDKKHKYRTAEEKRKREQDKNQRRRDREEKRKIREIKRKEREQREKERKSSSARRRKTSSRKLSRLKLSENLNDIPVNTPAPEDNFDKKDFLKAASAGRTKVVLKYIMDGGDVNVQDEHKRTALQKASLYGEMEVLDVLIQKKAKMNVSDKIGDTALHWACRGGQPEVIKKLVKSGCKINAKDKLFSTPLHVAVRCGVDNVIETLVKLGADINAKDRTGDTPMHDAVRLGRFKLIKILLAAGANLRALNLNKQTPIDMVQVWYKETKSEYANTILIHLQNSVARE